MNTLIQNYFWIHHHLECPTSAQ